MAKTEYYVSVSDAALAMLDSHINFLARVSVSATLRLMDEVLDEIASLSENPQRFPVYDNEFIPHNRYRRMLSNKRYLVIYEIDGKNVFVDYIIDCRQDNSWML